MPKARILAVDDQRYFRELIEGLLTDEGYEVVTATNGEEALRVLEREDFEIVLTDLVMPGIDGTELVKQIKERLPDQDVVVVTAVVDVKTAVGAMKQGATDYILKPFDRKALSTSLGKILQRRRLIDEHARLMAENLEYMGVLSLYERAAGLFSTLALEPLTERLVEGLCLETRAERGGISQILVLAGKEEPALRELLRDDSRLQAAVRWLPVREFPPHDPQTWETLADEVGGACMVVGCHTVFSPLLIQRLRHVGAQGRAVVIVGKPDEGYYWGNPGVVVRPEVLEGGAQSAVLFQDGCRASALDRTST